MKSDKSFACTQEPGNSAIEFLFVFFSSSFLHPRIPRGLFNIFPFFFFFFVISLPNGRVTRGSIEFLSRRAVSLVQDETFLRSARLAEKGKAVAVYPRNTAREATILPTGKRNRESCRLWKVKGYVGGRWRREWKVVYRVDRHGCTHAH